jgi:DNA transposition AAA+ family ATPase
VSPDDGNRPGSESTNKPMSQRSDNNELESNQTGEEFPTEEPTSAPGARFDSSQLRAEVHEVMVRQALKRSDVAKAIGYARSAVSMWLDDKYDYDAEALEAKVREWLAAQPRMTGGSFVETPTAERIISTLEYSRVHGDMCHIFGGPGVGKTSSLRHYVSLYPDRAWITTMTPASSGLVSALETIAMSLGLGAVTGGARRISAQIRNRLWQDTASVILIIDEAQHMSMAAIEEVRSIHDVTECGLALVGNETSHARLTGGARSANFAQIYSRLGAVLKVARPTAGDVDALCDSWHVTDAHARETLRRLADRPGALRSVNKVLRLISRSGQKVTRERVVSACRMLGAEV